MIAIPMIIMSDILNMLPQRLASLTTDLYKFLVFMEYYLAFRIIIS